jgi:hypothetical protein
MTKTSTCALHETLREGCRQTSTCGFQLTDREDGRLIDRDCLCRRVSSGGPEGRSELRRNILCDEILNTVLVPLAVLAVRRLGEI